MIGKKSIMFIGLSGLVALLSLIGFRSLGGGSEQKPQPQDCSSHRPLHSNLSSATSSPLRKLAEYEALCRTGVADRLMTFAAMPRTQEEALQFATSMATELKEFSGHEITPLVVFEPSSDSPTIIKDIQKGTYDPVLASYFAALKRAGVTDSMMGTWVLFPEANTPAWRITNPKAFSDNVTKVASLQKKVFPSSRVSLLLDGLTYPDNDTDWSDGEIKSLSPYVRDIPTGLVDEMGLQGFPRLPQATEPKDESKLGIETFLPTTLLREAADTLRVSKVWMNTGTFRRMYTDVPSAQVTLSSGQREAILSAIFDQAKALKETSSYDVSINLFAADKSETSEHVDWSYLKEQSNDAPVLSRFITKLHDTSVEFSLYDQTNED